jgi:hypothetical protein
LLPNAELPRGCDDQGNLPARQHSKADHPARWTPNPVATVHGPGFSGSRPREKRLWVYKYNENGDYTPRNSRTPSTIDRYINRLGRNLRYRGTTNSAPPIYEIRSALREQEQRDRVACLPLRFPPPQAPQMGSMVDRPAFLARRGDLGYYLWSRRGPDSRPGGCRSSVVEHPLGKGEVVGSIPTGSTTQRIRANVYLCRGFCS